MKIISSMISIHLKSYIQKTDFFIQWFNCTEDKKKKKKTGGSRNGIITKVLNYSNEFQL